MSKVPRVALLFETSAQAHRDILSGVLRYVKTHGPWRLHLVEGRTGEQRLLDMQAWGGSGVVGVIQNLAYAKAVMATRKPAVLIDPIDEHLLPPKLLKRHAIVASDQQAIGKMAAEYFLERGFTNFAYVSEITDINWSLERGAAFAGFIQEAGHKCQIYSQLSGLERRDWSQELPHLCQWLQKLTKPVAIFAAMDVRARQVLDACMSADIGVPDEAAVLAVDNDEVICDSTTPPLASIKLDTERMGYEAAQLLDTAMRQPGGRTKDVKRLYPPLRVISRRSAEAILMHDEVVARALEFIWLNAQSPIGVPDVVDHVRISRRMLEMRFKQALKHTIRDELQRARLKRVRSLLAETNLTITAITEACGYSDKSYLSKVFRQNFGTTMTQYRSTLPRNPPFMS